MRREHTSFISNPWLSNVRSVSLMQLPVIIADGQSLFCQLRSVWTKYTDRDIRQISERVIRNELNRTKGPLISFPEPRSPWPAVGKRELREQPFWNNKGNHQILRRPERSWAMGTRMRDRSLLIGGGTGWKIPKTPYFIKTPLKFSILLNKHISPWACHSSAACGGY